MERNFNYPKVCTRVGSRLLYRPPGSSQDIDLLPALLELTQANLQSVFFVDGDASQADVGVLLKTTEYFYTNGNGTPIAWVGPTTPITWTGPTHADTQALIDSLGGGTIDPVTCVVVWADQRIENIPVCFEHVLVGGVLPYIELGTANSTVNNGDGTYTHSWNEGMSQTVAVTSERPINIVAGRELNTTGSAGLSTFTYSNPIGDETTLADRFEPSWSVRLYSRNIDIVGATLDVRNSDMIEILSNELEESPDKVYTRTDGTAPNSEARHGWQKDDRVGVITGLTQGYRSSQQTQTIAYNGDPAVFNTRVAIAPAVAITQVCGVTISAIRADESFLSAAELATVTPNLLPDPAEFVFLADSFNNGLGIEPGALLGAETGIPVDLTFAISGAALRQIPAQIANQDFEGNPVLILRGINDITGQSSRTEEDYQQKMLEAIDASNAANAGPVFVGTLPPLSTTLDVGYTPARAQLVTDNNIWTRTILPTLREVTIIDIHAVLDLDNDGDLDAAFQINPGNIHPNAAGSAAMHENAIYPAVQTLFNV